MAKKLRPTADILIDGARAVLRRRLADKLEAMRS
jgi:hypothetical protein